MVVDTHDLFCGKEVHKRRHVANTGDIWWLATPRRRCAREEIFPWLRLQTGLDNIERGHCGGTVSTAGAAGRRGVLVSAVIVEPVAAAASFAWKGSMGGVRQNPGESDSEV